MVPLEWAIVLGACGVSFLIRMAPEWWLRGREPPGPVADALPWLPVVVAGTLAGVLHFGADAADLLPYLVAGTVAALSLAIRRSFYLPVVTGAVTLALWRHFL